MDSRLLALEERYNLPSARTIRQIEKVRSEISNLQIQTMERIDDLAHRIEDQSFNSVIPYDDLSPEPVYSDLDVGFEKHDFDEASTACQHHTRKATHNPK